MKILNWTYTFLFLSIASIFFYSCLNDNFDYNQAYELDFSVDTLRIDTVFTMLGSATRTLKVYNNNDGGVTIMDIQLANGKDSRFRLNIDGVPGGDAQDIEILPHDSMYIFVEVTVDPDEPLSASPFVIEEQLTFITNDNHQHVLLEAWGQNANYIPALNANGSAALLSCDLGSVVWDDPKPYVIYGILIIDSCELVLPSGTEIYVHGGLAKNKNFIYNDGLIVVLDNGSIRAEGDVDSPIWFQGDRLEEEYSDAWGQWAGIWISENSKNNSFENVRIKNSIVGIRVDSSAQLSLKNTEIYNISNIGLIGQHAEIYAENCLIHTTGRNSAALVYGGEYNFNYCTLSNAGNQSAAVYLDNVLERDSNRYSVYPLIADFTNCILTGTDKDEIHLFDITEKMEPTFFQVNFDHCVIKIDEILNEDQYPEFFDFCNKCIEYERGDTLFVDEEMQDYHLDTLSIAELKGVFIPNIDEDIEGHQRDQQMPDIGCYEYQD